jgi:hypothetical protein
MVFGLLLPLLLGVASEFFHFFGELDTSSEESAHELVYLAKFEDGIIVNLEDPFLRPHLEKMLLEDGFGIFDWQVDGSDDVGIVRIVLPLVEGALVIFDIVTIVHGLQD